MEALGIAGGGGGGGSRGPRHEAPAAQRPDQPALILFGGAIGLAGLWDSGSCVTCPTGGKAACHGLNL